MKFWEAMKALEEGKKVRCCNWLKHEFIFKELKYGFISYINDIWKGPSGYWVCNEWEIYEEPIKTYSFMEILPFLKEGKKIKRNDWSHHWKIINGLICIFCEEEYLPAHIYPKYLEATDWIIVND